MPVRKALGVRTVFNLLGPLTNPAGARRQLVGVADTGALDLVAGALARLDTDRALVVSSADGLDELSTSGPTHVVEVEGDTLRRYVVESADVGIPLAPPEALSGGTPQENAVIVRAILAGEPGPGATSRCSTAAPRSTPPDAPTRSPRASRPRAPRSTTAPPSGRSTPTSR